MRGRVAAAAAMCLLISVSCGGEDEASPTNPIDSSPMGSSPASTTPADRLIAAVEDLFGPCATVDVTSRDSRQVTTCTLESGKQVQVDVWISEAPVSAPHHLYRATQLARSTECMGTLGGIFANWLADGNWMIASTDATALDELRDELGGVLLGRPDCARSTCDDDPPWTQIDLRHTADGFAPQTIELQADGAELCVTSDTHEVVDAMFVALPGDYETGELVSAVVTDRQISRITSVMTGRSERSPLSTWLEAGHHLVLVERPGYVTMAWDAAAIQLRPDVGPPPAYATSPITDVAPDAAPLRFLLDGARVVSGEEDDRSGEFTLVSEETDISLYWTTLRSEPFDEFVDDRRSSGAELAPAEVAGFEAVLVAYTSTDHTAMLHDATYLYEFRADATEPEFRSLLDGLEVVSDAAWSAAYSSELVTPDEGATVVAGMLEGVDVPDALDPAAFDDLDVSGDRYHVGAAVVGRVVCAWLEIWEANPVDSPAHDEAVAAVAAADTWPILVEMERGGGYTDYIREIGRSVVRGGDANTALTFLDECSR